MGGDFLVLCIGNDVRRRIVKKVFEVKSFILDFILGSLC